jgi:hypothetical protein
MKHVILTILPLALFMVFLAEARAEAYLDPGSGSMLVQLLLGGVAGVAVIARLGWQRFRDLFRPRESKPEGQPKSHE